MLLHRARGILLQALLLSSLACDSDEDRRFVDAGVVPADAAFDTALTPNCNPAEGALPGLVLTPIATGLDNPLLVVAAPGDGTRLFVIEQEGRIRVIVEGELLAEPFLDIGGLVQAGGERGLLGLAFHPGYADSRRFFVHYTAQAAAGAGPSGTAVLSEFTTLASDANRADAASERRLLTLVDPEGNHNGGMLEFGPDDGLLYVAIGDGGGGGDDHGPIGNGQNLGTWFGKILRVDVDARDAGEYGIPAGNMSQAGALPEIWSFGWRNPWRFSFDRCTSDMYVGDVGQGRLEEIDFEPSSAPSGGNYGWRSMEAEACFNPAENCNPNNDLILPVASYARDVGRSITGGYVYRGNAIPALRGSYFYADYVTARFFSLRMSGGARVEQREITADLNPGGAIGNISSFGTNNAGEVFVTSMATDAVYRIDAE